MEAERRYLSVAALTKYIKRKLEGDVHLVSILLKGEISNFKKHSRGHFYFSLKDDQASIGAIMFARDTLSLSSIAYSPKDGDQVLVQGKISLYEPSGSYSIQVFKMEPAGQGELYLRYEALKKAYEEKGYFSIEHKKKIPAFPKVIGVVTSPTGAVIQDIMNTVRRRYPLAEIHLYPALVQGEGGAASIREQILKANHKDDADVLIVGRGGGSIEDLWAFNEVPVIEAIFQSRIPIITAIGHETDTTISDYVADLRAPTPTAAAELATPNINDLRKKIDESIGHIEYRITLVIGQKKTDLLHLDQRLVNPSDRLMLLRTDLERLSNELTKNFLYQIEHKENRLNQLISQLKSPVQQVRIYQERLAGLKMNLDKSFVSIHSQNRSLYEQYVRSLNNLNPLNLMDKGYAVVQKKTKVMTSVKDIEVDDTVSVRFKDGTIDAKVIAKKGE